MRRFKSFELDWVLGAFLENIMGKINKEICEWINVIIFSMNRIFNQI